MSATREPSISPTTFRLPQPGENDPHFGLTRIAYYFGEARGWWKLKRLIGEGKEKGITLVPYDEVAARIRAHGITAPQNSAKASAAAKISVARRPTSKGVKRR